MRKSREEEEVPLHKVCERYHHEEVPLYRSNEGEEVFLHQFNHGDENFLQRSREFSHDHDD